MATLQEKLAQANQKAETQKAERRARVVKGSHLTEQFVNLARNANCDIRENNGFHVITGVAGKSKRIYVAKRGGIVDLLGFSVVDEAVVQITPEVAKAKHMGRVQGRLNMDVGDESLLTAFTAAVAVLSIAAPVVEKKERKLRVKKTETPEQTVATEVQVSA